MRGGEMRVSDAVRWTFFLILERSLFSTDL